MKCNNSRKIKGLLTYGNLQVNNQCKFGSLEMMKLVDYKSKGPISPGQCRETGEVRQVEQVEGASVVQEKAILTKDFSVDNPVPGRTTISNCNFWF